MRTLCLIIFYILFSGTVNCQEWTSRIDSVLSISTSEGLFDGQVLIAENGKVLFSKAYGRNENGEVIMISSPLSIASVSKAFTALSILILHDRELLNINQYLKEFLPELPYEEATIKSMLNMTSGLPRFQHTLEIYGDSSKIYSANEIVKMISKYQPKSISPGIQFSYNNDNYMLLAMIVEQVSGQPFAQFVMENIFDPLEMKNSFVFKEVIDDDYSDLTSSTGPALGEDYVYSTAEDLYLFDQSLYTNKLLSLNTFNQSFVFTNLIDSTLSNYGFAWRLNKDDKVNEVYMIGESEDVRASIQRFMNQRKTFIYIHNRSGANWKQVYNATRNIWEGKPFELPQKRVVFAIDTTLYKQYVGRYLSKPFGLIHITKEDGKLYLRPDPIPGKELLVPSSTTTFFFSGQALEWEFFLNDNGNVIGLGLKGQPETIGLKQVP